MFLNILRISALNVLKTFFINKTVTIGCSVAISIRTNRPETGRQESKITIRKMI